MRKYFKRRIEVPGCGHVEGLTWLMEGRIEVTRQTKEAIVKAVFRDCPHPFAIDAHSRFSLYRAGVDAGGLVSKVDGPVSSLT